MNQDDSHLNALAIAHYVVGGFMVLFACLPLMHMFLGLSMALNIGDMQESMMRQNGSQAMSQPPFPPELFGWFFFGMGLLFFILGQAISISIIVSGRFLHQRKNYMFSFVLACVACMMIPFGTILGVFTIIVLSRDSVKALYGRLQASAPVANFSL